MSGRSSRPSQKSTRLSISTARIGWRGQHHHLRHQARLAPEQQELIIALMLEREGLAGACAKAGVGLGLVLAERRRNPAFRRALAAAEKQRLALLEMLLTDIVVRGLLASPDGKTSDTREKFLGSLAQALIEKSKGSAPAKPAAVRASKTKAAEKTPPAVSHDELSALLAETERRIAEAEAELAKEGKNS